MNNSALLLLRVTVEEKLGFGRAETAWLPISAWTKKGLRLAAIRDLVTAGLRAPFTQPTGLTNGY